MTLKKEFSKSVIANWVGIACSVVLAFIFTPIIVHSFGNERYGIWSVAMSLTGYYGIFEVGVKTTIIRYFAHYYEKKEYDSINILINTMAVNYFVIIPFIMALVLILQWKVDSVFNIDPDLVNDTRILIVVVGVNFCINALANTYRAILFGLRKFALQNALRVSFSIVRYTLVIIFLKTGFGIVGVAVVITVLDQLWNIVLYIIIKRLFPSLRFSFSLIRIKEMKEQFTFVFFDFLRHMSTRVMERADVLLVGIFVNMEAVAMYSIAESLLRYVSKVPKGINSVILPFSSKISASKEKSKLKKMVSILPKYTMSFLMMAFICALLFGKDFLNLWLGPGYDFSFVILMILMVPKVVADSQKVLTQILVGMGYNRFYGVLSFVEVVINISASAVLAKYYGAIGIALGTLFTITITRGLLVPIYTMKKMEMGIIHYYYNCLARPTIPWFILYFINSLVVSLENIFLAPLVVIIYLIMSHFLVYDEIKIKKWKLRFNI